MSGLFVNLLQNIPCYFVFRSMLSKKQTDFLLFCKIPIYSIFPFATLETVKYKDYEAQTKTITWLTVSFNNLISRSGIVAHFALVSTLPTCIAIRSVRHYSINHAYDTSDIWVKIIFIFLRCRMLNADLFMDSAYTLKFRLTALDCASKSFHWFVRVKGTVDVIVSGDVAIHHEVRFHFFPVPTIPIYYKNNRLFPLRIWKLLYFIITPPTDCEIVRPMDAEKTGRSYLGYGFHE